MFKRFRHRKAESKADIHNEQDGRTPCSSDLDHIGSKAAKDLHISPSSQQSTARPKNITSTQSSLGLRVLYQPDFPSLDIIFVHGLGGHSQNTWSKDENPDLFWPELWLPLEQDVGKARISTFGYDSTFKGGPKNISTVSDFAKNLLYDMRFARDAEGRELGIGRKPIIFIVHSMGGLVIKKAYLLGLQDETYKQMINSVSAIIFLSTPHRGTDLAKTLKRILTAFFQSSKRFISDLEKNSGAIEDLNDQFRHVAPNLSIWSFYETLATPVGYKKIMILEKDSSVLGYPGEISRPLQANHREVCKYSSPSDSNYLSVRNAIKSLVSTSLSKKSTNGEMCQTENVVDIQTLFRNCQMSEEDYIRLRQDWISGTCEWFFEQSEVKCWMEPSCDSRILWYTAPPASGKSTLAAFVIDRLQKLSMKCQYFLFSYTGEQKRSVAGSLRAIALQLAKDIPDFRDNLGGASSSTLGLESTDPRLIWRNTFEKLFFETKLTAPVYWVFDALDESDSPNVLLECLRDLPTEKTPIKVLVLSRNTNPISVGFDRFSDTHINVIKMEQASGEHSRTDIGILVESGIRNASGSEQFRQKLKGRILSRAEGNFLWAKLVTDEIQGCYTEDSIEEVLTELPDNMISLYRQMEKSLLNSTRRSNKPLISSILEWSICAQRSLTLTELAQALQPRFPKIIDLSKVIRDACGQFIHISNSETVSIIHHTAREYFLSNRESHLHINEPQTHEKLLFNTLSHLKDAELRWKLTQSQRNLQASEPFLFYAAVSWPYHLSRSRPTSVESLDVLLDFFRGPAVLAWVHVLSLLRHLETLVAASNALLSYVNCMLNLNNTKNPLLHRHSDLGTLDGWVVDLVKLVGKFGPILVAEPSAIYDIVPAFCPAGSLMYRQYYDSESSPITILGGSDLSWNDSLGRLTLPNDAQAWQIECAGNNLAVLASTGVTYVWDFSNFTEITNIDHGEPVTAMNLSSNGLRLVTYGLKTTKVWSVFGARQLFGAKNPLYTKAIRVEFVENDQKILLVGDDNVIRLIRFDSSDDGWEALDPKLLKDQGRTDGAIVSSPSCLAFNDDKSYVAVAYRGAPLSVWRLLDGRCMSIHKRWKDMRSGQHQGSRPWFAVHRVAWNPVTGHILGIYRGGSIFKWHPVTDEHVETLSAADEIAVSPNGKVFATSSTDGSVRIWSFNYFSVIYKLNSGDLVTGILFTPDSGQLFDIRGGSINGWKSNILTRLMGGEDVNSDAQSEISSSTAVSKQYESHVDDSKKITACASAPNSTGSSCLIGYEDGTVTLLDSEMNQGAEIARFHNYLDVTLIVWSPDGSYIALADLAGDIQVRAVNSEGGYITGSILQSAPNINLEADNIQQITFSPSLDFLLVVTNWSVFVCSVKDGTLRHSAAMEAGAIRRWICHPTQPEFVLAFGPYNVITYTWNGLCIKSTSTYHAMHRTVNGEQKYQETEDDPATTLNELLPSDDSPLEPKVNKAILAKDNKHIILDIRFFSHNSGPSQQTLVFPLGCLETDAQGEGISSSLGYLNIPDRIISQIKMPLDILSGTRLVFLDHALWICTFKLRSRSPSMNETVALHNRHYFLPRDWVGSHSLENCCMENDGSLFWSRDDKVLLIKCNLNEQRVDS